MPHQSDKSHELKTRRWIVPVLVILGGLLAYFLVFKGGKEISSPDQLIREVVGSEELILVLSPDLGQISNGLMNLLLPDDSSRASLFAEVVSVTDLASTSEPGEDPSQMGIGERSGFEIAANASEIPRAELALWSSLLAEVDYFEHATFKFVDAEFVGATHDQFKGLVKFGGLARKQSGAWTSLSGKLVVTWRQRSDGEWRITAWKSTELIAKAAGQRLFSDRLDEALPAPGDRQRARHSIHEEELVKYYQSGKTRARS
ncbi:MAG: hypothetical protein ACI9UA_006030, partial [Pseudoalteromonas tetraodonis]